MLNKGDKQQFKTHCLFGSAAIKTGTFENSLSLRYRSKSPSLAPVMSMNDRQAKKLSAKLSKMVVHNVNHENCNMKNYREKI